MADNGISAPVKRERKNTVKTIQISGPTISSNADEVQSIIERNTLFQKKVIRRSNLTILKQKNNISLNKGDGHKITPRHF